MKSMRPDAKSKMRIFYVIGGFGMSGDERITNSLCKYYDRSNFSLEIVTLSNKKDQPVGEMPTEDTRIHCLYEGGYFRRFRLSKIIYCIGKMVKLARLYRPNIILANGLASIAFSATVCVILKACGYRIKFISIQGNITSESIGASKGGLSVLWLIIYRFFFCLSDVIIVQSNDIKRDLVECIGVKNPNIHVFYNPVDLEYIRERLLEPVDHPYFFDRNFSVIISVCRLVPRKGLTILFHAFERLLRSYNCKLVIIGDGPQYEELRSLAIELGIDPHTAFLGFQRNPFKYITRADILAHTSLFEGFGYSVVEAMVCNVPVIATMSGAPMEIICNGINGLLVPPGDVESLFAAIASLLDDPNKGKIMASNALRRLDEFSADRIVSLYQDVMIKTWECI